MAEELETALLGTIGEQYVPRKYMDFRLCREMGWTLEYLYQMPEDEYRTCLEFMNAEGRAQVHASRRSEFGL